MFLNRRALGYFFRAVFSCRHPAHAPGLERQLQRCLEVGANRVLLLQEGLHQFGRLARTAQNRKTLPGLRGHNAIGRNRAVIIDAQK